MTTTLPQKWKLVVYASYLLLLLWWALLLLLSPLMLLYGLALLGWVWTVWAKRGKDLLVVLSDYPRASERGSRIMALVESRANFLNWSERQSWSGRSLAAQIFGFYRFFFGPDPSRIPDAMPIVIVFPRWRGPKTFSFEGFRTDDDAVIQRLQLELARSRD